VSDQMFDNILQEQGGIWALFPSHSQESFTNVFKLTSKFTTHLTLHFNKSAVDSRRQLRFRPWHFDDYCHFTICYQTSTTRTELKTMRLISFFITKTQNIKN